MSLPSRLRRWTISPVPIGLAIALGSAGFTSAEPTEPWTESVTSSGSFLGSNGEWEELAPPRRYKHASAYDALRRRVVIFGDGRPSVWTYPIDAPCDWSMLPTNGTGPSKDCQSAVYDSIGDRVLAFGGDFSDEVFQLPLGRSSTWSVLETEGERPYARGGNTLVYDPRRNRVVLFGGGDPYFGGGYYNDAWELELSGTPRWSRLAPSGTPPTGRGRHAAVYDPIRDRMIVFGGEVGYSPSSETWALSFSPSPAWSPIITTGPVPEPRLGAAAVFDADQDRMLVSGGLNTFYTEGGSPISDLVALNLGGTPAWSGLLGWNAAGPRPRYGASLAYDRDRGRAIVYGGQAKDDLCSDSWIAHLDGAPRWELASGSPRGRTRATMVFDVARDRPILFGGYAAFFSVLGYTWVFGDVFAYSSCGWRPLTAEPGPARADHSSILDPDRDRMVVFGGTDLGTVFNDVWSLSLGDPVVWERLTPVGDPPPARRRHTAVLDPGRARMIVFGGFGENGFLNDTWALTLEPTPSWERILPLGEAPPARLAHAAIYDPVRDRMVIYGGGGAAGNLVDIWALKLTGEPRWFRLNPGGTAPAFSDVEAAYDPDRDRMVLTAGYFGQMSSVEFSPTLSWRSLSPGGIAPASMGNRKGAYDPVRRRMIFTCGGGGYGDFASDILAFNFGRTRRARPMPPRAWVEPGRPEPNPFQDETRFTIEIAEPSRIKGVVYGVDGRMVADVVDGAFASGRHEFTWNGRNASGRLAPPGIYWVRVIAGHRRFDSKVVRLP